MSDRILCIQEKEKGVEYLACLFSDYWWYIDIHVEVSGICLYITYQIIHIWIMLFLNVSLDFPWSYPKFTTTWHTMLSSKGAHLPVNGTSLYTKCPKISYTKVSHEMAYANSVIPDQTAPRDIPCLCKLWWIYTVNKGRLKKPTDLNLHFLSLRKIYIKNLDQVIWLAEN